MSVKMFSLTSLFPFYLSPFFLTFPMKFHIFVAAGPSENLYRTQSKLSSVHGKTFQLKTVLLPSKRVARKWQKWNAEQYFSWKIWQKNYLSLERTWKKLAEPDNKGMAFGLGGLAKQKQRAILINIGDKHWVFYKIFFLCLKKYPRGRVHPS